MAILKPITQSSFIVTIQGVQSIWTTFSGINDSADTSTYANPTGNRLGKVVGPRAVDDVTLSSPYSPELSVSIEQLWLEYQCEYLTILVQPTSCDGETSLGPPYVLQGCQLNSLNVAEVDRESGSVATIELGLTVNSWTRSS